MHDNPHSTLTTHTYIYVHYQVEVELASTQLLEAFLELASDDQDSVRLQTVDNCVALAKVCTTEGDGREGRRTGAIYAEEGRRNGLVC